MAFNMVGLMEILKVYLKEYLLIKYYVLKYIILLKIQNMMDIKVDLIPWFINLLIKKLLVVLLKVI